MSTNYIDAETLAAAVELRNKLDEQIRTMQQQLQQRRYPKVPGTKDGNMFGVNIKFQPRGTVYRFLILRTPAKGWYTTGQGESGHFQDWTALIDWLRGPDIHWHGAIYQLQETGHTVLDAERN